MKRHRPGSGAGIARQQRLDNRQVLMRFFRQTPQVVALFVPQIRHVAKPAKENLEPAQFEGKKFVAARIGDQVVQPAIDLPGLVDEFRGRGKPHRQESAELGRQLVQLGQIDAAASASRGFTFQRSPNLANLADILGRDVPHDGAAIGRQVNDADACQADQGLADRRVADAEAHGELLSDKMLAGAEPAVKYIGKKRLHNGLPTQAVFALCKRRDRQDFHEIRVEFREAVREPRLAGQFDFSRATSLGKSIL